MRENRLLQNLVDATRSLPPAAPVVFAVEKPTKGEVVPIWQASDWHVEEKVEADRIQGLNNYDVDLAHERAGRFFQNGLKLTSMAAHESTLRRIVLVLGGDFITGSIHPDAAEKNQLGPTTAIAFARDLLVSGIKKILKETDCTLDIPCVVGNHGRTTPEYRFATAIENNLEYLLYQWIASEFVGNKRVRFHVCSGTMQFVSLFSNYTIRVVHGYEIRSGGGVGGVTIPIRKKLANWNQARRAELTLIHHFHQRMDGGDHVVNGSLIGYNAYSQANGFAYEPPQQQFTLIHSRNGGEKTIVAPIWVT